MTRPGQVGSDPVSDALGAWLEDTADELSENPHLFAAVRAHLPTIRQRRHRWLPSLPELRPGPTVRTARATAVVAVVVLCATLAVSWIPTDPAIGPATPVERTLVVAMDGSGDHTTIAGAIEAAKDSDTILVEPGTYVESLIITKDITIRGDGDRAAVVIEAPDGGPVASTHGDVDDVDDDTLIYPVDDPYAVLLLDSSATLSGLTFRGQHSEVHASGGAPTLRDLAFEGVGVTGRYGTGKGGNAIVVNDGSRVVILDNTLTDGGPIGVVDGSNPLIEGNTLTNGPFIAAGVGAEAIIRDNHISHASPHGINVYQEGVGGWLIEGNTISDVDGTGIGTQHGVEAGSVIRGNTIERTMTAISLIGDALIVDNELRDNTGGIFVLGGSPMLDGNTVTGGVTGVALVGSDTTPAFRDNTICDNETNLKLSAGAAMPATEGDVICPDEDPTEMEA